MRSTERPEGRATAQMIGRQPAPRRLRFNPRPLGVYVICGWEWHWDRFFIRGFQYYPVSAPYSSHLYNLMILQNKNIRGQELEEIRPRQGRMGRAS